jgi:hypothetical protein
MSQDSARPGSSAVDSSVGHQRFEDVVADHEGVAVGFVGRVETDAVAAAAENQGAALFGGFFGRSMRIDSFS